MWDEESEGQGTLNNPPRAMEETLTMGPCGSEPFEGCAPSVTSCVNRPMQKR